jgi:hypothetical protein
MPIRKYPARINSALSNHPPVITDTPPDAGAFPPYDPPGPGSSCSLSPPANFPPHHPSTATWITVNNAKDAAG